MDRGAMIWGARSGIQKAVRRGDVSLAYTCFETLWADAESQRWLMWRAPVLAMEDAWHMTGFVPRDGQKEDWRRFLLTLTVARKNQDAGWLWLCAKDGRRCASAEWEAMRELVDLARERGGPREKMLPFHAVRAVLERRFFPMDELTDYERAIIDTAERRRAAGGMEADAYIALAVHVLVFARGVDVDDVRADVEAQRKLFAGTSVKRLGALPWFCWDMHTRQGLMALRVFLKKYARGLGIGTESEARGLWFHGTSARLGDRVMPTVRGWEETEGDRRTWRDMVWRDENRLTWLGPGHEAKLSRWLTDGEPAMERLVVWALSKS